MRRPLLLTLMLGTVFLGSIVLPLQADELKDTVQKQQNIESKKEQAQGQLNQLTFRADKMKAELAQLEEQIKTAQNELERKQLAYAQAQAQVMQAEKELEKKKEELKARQQALSNRLRGIYEIGQVSYLEILFQSADLGDFVSRVEYLASLVANDRELLTKIQSEKAQLTEKAKILESRRDQAAQLKAQAAQVKADLDKKKSQHEQALLENQKAQQEIFDEIDKLEAESNALAEKIRKLQASRKGGVIGSITTWPLAGYTEISDAFGWRIHPVTHTKRLHTGVDIPAPTGTAIRAAGSGVVIQAGWNTAYGNMVVIDHGGGVSTLYGHQSKLAVSEGQEVKAGDVIGYVGSTGWSTGPHLHFEVRIGGNPTDPLQYFR